MRKLKLFSLLIALVCAVSMSAERTLQPGGVWDETTGTLAVKTSYDLASPDQPFVGDLPEPQPAVHYYVIGSMTGWSTNEAYELTVNPEAEWEFMGDFTFAAADEFKVIDGSGNWYPAAAGNFVVSEAGDYTVYFRPDGNGGEGWHAGCIYTAVKSAVHYYVIGTMTGWSTNEAYELTVNPEADWEFMGGFTFAAADEFKVIDGSGNWYPAAAGNFVVSEAGDYTVYFRPDGNGGEGWYEGCIYVEMPTEPQPAVQYYVIGSMTGWSTNEAYELTVNPEAEWEFMGEFTFAAADEFKVIDGSGNWYPAAADNFVISEAGDYTVYFRPDGNGGEGWHAGCIYAALHPQGVDITANSDQGVYYSTFYDSQMKYLLPAGVEAYAATVSGNDLLMTKIAQAGDVIPADNAVIFKSTVSSFTITPSDAAPVAFSVTNNLQGTDEDINTVPDNCYVLSGHSTDYSVTGVGFYRYEGTVLHAHKAYVVLSGSNAPQRMRFIFEEEQNAMGVENTEAENMRCTKVVGNGVFYVIKNGVRYNAQGQIVK